MVPAQNKPDNTRAETDIGFAAELHIDFSSSCDQGVSQISL
jgi:hypothetical protein